MSLMEVAIRNDIPGIVAVCGGACSCATCHVYVADGWFQKLNPADETELSMLELAVEVRPTSRLSCQVRINDQLDGLVVTTPEEQC